jgi:hypothetical protein
MKMAGVEEVEDMIEAEGITGQEALNNVTPADRY